MLSYHADADIHTNPYELGFDRLVNLETDIDFIGKEALKKIKQKNIALAMIEINYSELGNQLDVQTHEGKYSATIVEKPFYDPKKKIASS